MPNEKFSMSGSSKMTSKCQNTILWVSENHGSFTNLSCPLICVEEAGAHPYKCIIVTCILPVLQKSKPCTTTHFKRSLINLGLGHLWEHDLGYLISYKFKTNEAHI
jgi:hypothetical protein